MIVRVLLAAASLLAGGVRADAHELGPTRVHITLEARGTYEVALVGDPDVLLARLEALSGLPTIRRTSPEDRLRAVSAELLQNIQIRFDGALAKPAVLPGFQTPPEEGEEGPETSSSGPKAIVLRGIASAGAQFLSWQCAFLYGAYPIIVSSPERVVVWANGTSVTEPVRLSAQAGAFSTIAAYVRLGITHIVPGGLDHVLFVLGVFLLSARPRDVLAQVSAFTVAHSLTLGLGLSGVVAMSATLVEPLIAMSIAYVAVENVVASRLKAQRLAVVFACGLLHGLGFAGVLSEVGVPADRFFHALFGFNAGVEVGQLAVIALAYAVSWPWTRNPTLYRRFLAIPASYALAVTGVAWAVIRVSG